MTIKTVTFSYFSNVSLLIKYYFKYKLFIKEKLA